MLPDDTIRLRHMLDAANEAVTFAQGNTRSDLDNNRMLVLALVKDSRSSSHHWGLNNSVTNKADVTRMFNSWAMQINSSLVKVTGKTE
jgi:hypothetical protein